MTTIEAIVDTAKVERNPWRNIETSLTLRIVPEGSILITSIKGSHRIERGDRIKLKKDGYDRITGYEILDENMQAKYSFDY
jgi:hypothetical protein